MEFNTVYPCLLSALKIISALLCALAWYYVKLTLLTISYGILCGFVKIVMMNGEKVNN